MSSACPQAGAVITNRQLILPYAAPYLAYVGIAALLADYLSSEANYLLRLVVVSALLCWAWRWYCPLTGPRSIWGSVLVGTGAGLVGLILWVALLSPFVEAGVEPAWSPQAFALRLLSAGLLVPVFEELMMRGYLFRLAWQWDQARRNGDKNPLHLALDHSSINTVAPGSWSWAAVGLSTLAFASGHTLVEWPAAVAYGLLMALLWIRRQDLLTCIVAHAVTNVGLAGYVMVSGQWQYW